MEAGLHELKIINNPDEKEGIKQEVNFAQIGQFEYVYLLSFACAKESNKEKHTGNDVRPLPDALIKLQYYC